MTAYVGLSVYLHLFLTGTIRRWLVSFMYQPLCSSYPFNRRLGGPQNRPGRFGEQIKPLPLPGVEAWLQTCQSDILATVPTESLRLLRSPEPEFNPSAVPVGYVIQRVWCSLIYGRFGFPLSITIPSELRIQRRDFVGRTMGPLEVAVKPKTSRTRTQE